MNNSLSVFYVEDCEATVELFRLCLKKYYPDNDIALDVVGTVSEAFEKFSTDKHVAALIDWNLPDGEGTEVAQHIRQLHKTLPLIFLSAYFNDKHLLAAQQYNPSDCLVKEYSSSFVDRIVRHIPV